MCISIEFDIEIESNANGFAARNNGNMFSTQLFTQERVSELSGKRVVF